MKMFGKILLVGVVIVVGLLGLSGLYHGYQLRKEAKAYPPPGELVSIDDNRMHV
ncbi:hypothetical protein KGY77_09570 [Candidatus Bipolaricaulota bacterium]|nr:hypothetical protein [Candidatus Bipolaricaulota bacterium]